MLFFPAFNRPLLAKILSRPFFLGFHSLLMADEKADDKKARWKVPLGLVATGVAGAAVLVLRGCWHRKMSWPVRSQNCSYQVCLGCGIKRLFDEKAFRAYGPYSYELKRLIAWDEKRSAAATPQQRPA